MMDSPLRLALLVSITAFIATHAEAQEPERGAELNAPVAEETGELPISVEVLGGTTAPLDVWVGANLVLYDRLVLTTSIGRVVYGGLAGSVATGIGGDEANAIVEPLFSDAWIFRLGVGLRPFGNRGPEAIVGYARLNASATWDAGTAGLPASLGTLSASVGVNMIFIELGWSIDIFGPLFIRPAIGWTQTLGARVSPSTTADLNAQAAAAMETAVGVVEDEIVTYGMTPTLSLSLGARF